MTYEQRQEAESFWRAAETGRPMVTGWTCSAGRIATEHAEEVEALEREALAAFVRKHGSHALPA